MGGAVSRTKRLTLDERVQHIRRTPFFLYLDVSTLGEFGKCFPTTVFVKKGDILTLNENLVYIIAKGELNLSTTMADPKYRLESKGYLCKKRPGDIISKPKEQRLATEKLSPQTKKMESFVEEVETRACQDSLLLCSNKAALKLFLTTYPELSTPFNTIVSSHIETYLANIPFLQQLTSTKLTVLATMCRYESLDANCTVFEENSPSDKLYIVLNGKSTVLAPQWVGNATVMQQSLEWGNQQKRQDSDIADLKSGDYFGETSLFANINRTSTIRTREKSLFVTVGKKTFENFCAVCPEIKVKMQSLMKERLVSNLSSLGVPFLEGIPPATLQLLTSRVEVHDTQIDEVVFREGDAGDRFYIIVHGEVKVEKEHEKGEMEEDCNENSSPEIRSLGVLIAGNYFGEMALVSDLPRSATVISTSKSILLSIDQASFSAIFGKNQNSLAEFTLRFFRGSSELRHFVSHSLGMSIFRIFLRKSVAEENLDFWIAANEFQKSFKEEQSPESSKAKAEEIIFLYVTDGSMHQVNLPYSLKTSIEESAIHYNLFTNSADEIYRLMVRDSYARFKKTTEFFAFFKYLGILIDDNERI